MSGQSQPSSDGQTCDFGPLTDEIGFVSTFFGNFTFNGAVVGTSGEGIRITPDNVGLTQISLDADVTGATSAVVTRGPTELTVAEAATVTAQSGNGILLSNSFFVSGIASSFEILGTVSATDNGIIATGGVDGLVAGNISGGTGAGISIRDDNINLSRIEITGSVSGANGFSSTGQTELEVGAEGQVTGTQGAAISFGSRTSGTLDSAGTIVGQTTGISSDGSYNMSLTDGSVTGVTGDGISLSQRTGVGHRLTSEADISGGQNGISVVGPYTINLAEGSSVTGLARDGISIGDGDFSGSLQSGARITGYRDGINLRGSTELTVDAGSVTAARRAVSVSGPQYTVLIGEESEIVGGFEGLSLSGHTGSRLTVEGDITGGERAIFVSGGVDIAIAETSKIVSTTDNGDSDANAIRLDSSGQSSSMKFDGSMNAIADGLYISGGSVDVVVNGVIEAGDTVIEMLGGGSLVTGVDATLTGEDLIIRPGVYTTLELASTFRLDDGIDLRITDTDAVFSGLLETGDLTFQSFGSTLLISGTVEGDVILGGFDPTLQITGIVEGDVIGNDIISGSATLNIDARAGRIDGDVLLGLRDDTFLGTALEDTVEGGSGNDAITGNIGADVLQGESGNDTLYGDFVVALSGIEGEVFRAYQAALGRAPDAAGFAAVVNELRLGNQTQLDVITAFVASEEFANTYGELSDRAFVEQLYRNVLGREGDSGGIDAFTGEIEAGNLSRAEAVQALANSPEFVNASIVDGAAFATNVSVDPVEAQVFRIYQAVFDRAPDEGGFEAFVAEIGSGRLSLLDALDFFVTSEEFVDTYASLSNAAFVDLLYTNVLPGNTDAQGRAAFTAALDDGSLSRAGVVASFVDSFEFVTAQQDAATAFSRSVQTDRDDVLDGGAGDDVMLGGQGADTFVLSEGADVVLDFQLGIDRLDATALGPDFDTLSELLSVASQVGLDTVFALGNGNTLTLENVDLDAFSDDALLV